MRQPVLVLLMLLFAMLLSPTVVRSCPMCSEAVPAGSGTEELDQARIGQAYNNSIYLMAGMPYLLLGTVGFLIYRQTRLRDAGKPPVPDVAQPLPPGEHNISAQPGVNACSLPSRDGDS
jgi:hypothetical protein